MNGGLIDSLLGTIKTDNQIGFDNGTITKIILGSFVAAVLSGITIKALAKALNL